MAHLWHLPHTQPLTIASRSKILELNFIKVKGHTGVDGNEEADRLAKKAVGVTF